MGNQTVGGIFGYWLRRAIHLSMILFPFAYYGFGENLPNILPINREQLVSFIVLLTVGLELVRLKFGLVLIGQRDYEKKQISAAAWGMIGCGLVLLIAPHVGLYGAALGTPLILSLSIADPIIGECRKHHVDAHKIFWIALLLILIIWSVCAICLKTPWWLIPFVAPVTVLSEKPNFDWIDDNALMLLIPLALVVLLWPWVS